MGRPLLSGDERYTVGGVEVSGLWYILTPCERVDCLGSVTVTPELVGRSSTYPLSGTEREAEKDSICNHVIPITLIYLRGGSGLKPDMRSGISGPNDSLKRFTRRVKNRF